MRILYGSIAVAHCPHCGKPVVKQSAEQIVEAIIGEKSWSSKLELEKGTIPLSNSNSKLELTRETGRDYVKEMEQACRRAGLKFGVYVSPWDRHDADYASPKYVEKYHAQIKELLSGDYGEIFEMWFDGANGGDGWYGGAKERRKIGGDYYRFPEVFKFV